jgi:outer membrane protease
MRLLWAALLSLSCTIPLCAFDISFAFGTGILTSAAHEYVYEGGKCISRLDWKDSALPVLSFSGQAALSRAFLRLWTLPR